MGLTGPEVVASRLGSGSVGRLFTTEAHVLPLSHLVPLARDRPGHARGQRGTRTTPLVCPMGPSPVLRFSDMVDWQFSHGAWTVWPELPTVLREAIPTGVTMPRGKARLVVRAVGMMAEEPVFNLSVGTAIFGGRIRQRSGMEEFQWDLGEAKRTRLVRMIHSGPSLRAALKRRGRCSDDTKAYRNHSKASGRVFSGGPHWRETPIKSQRRDFRLMFSGDGMDFGCNRTGQDEYSEADNVMVVVHRAGNCSFADKALNAQLRGASGILVIDKVDSGHKKNLVMTCEIEKNWLCRYVHIPAVSVPAVDFAPVLSLLTAGHSLFAQLLDAALLF